MPSLLIAVDLWDGLEMLPLGSKQQETTTRTITSVETVPDSLHVQIFPLIPAGPMLCIN